MTQGAKNMKEIIKAKLANKRRNCPDGEKHIPDSKLLKGAIPDATGIWVDVSNGKVFDKARLKVTFTSKLLNNSVSC